MRQKESQPVTGEATREGGNRQRVDPREAPPEHNDAHGPGGGGRGTAKDCRVRQRVPHHGLEHCADYGQCCSGQHGEERPREADVPHDPLVSRRPVGQYQVGP